MKKIVKKLSAITMALTLLSTGNVFALDSAKDKNTTLIASAASVNPNPGYSPHHCGEHMVYELDPLCCTGFWVRYDRKCSVCGQVYGYKMIDIFGNVIYG
ncbi:MAG: hypothetical protein IJL32_08335 [Oscillospiraceae bacterium]|nr:hypothetical protein [Oscillospiraceae bacterium]